jgi:hypothetical protein
MASKLARYRTLGESCTFIRELGAHIESHAKTSLLAQDPESPGALIFRLTSIR